MKTVILFVFCFTISALAQEIAKTDYGRCRTDYINFCHSIGWQKVVDTDYGCLREHLDFVSQECRETLSSKVADPCFKDTIRICPKVLWKARTALDCLRQNKSDLSPGCRKRLDFYDSEAVLVAKLCDASFERLCPKLLGQELQRCKLRVFKENLLPADCAQAIRVLMKSAK